MTANEILSPACGRNCLLTILLSSDIYACRRMESVAGNANTDDIYQVRNGAAMNFYRQYDKIEKCGKCELKGVCRGCPSVSYGYTGNPYAADPQWRKVIE